MGMDMYNPSCAYACRSVIEAAPLNCSTAATTPACRASSAPFLTTLAYCIKDYCFPEFDPPRAKVEWYWYAEATGDGDVPPMWSWQETCDKINVQPKTVYVSKAKKTMSETMQVDQDDWLATKRKQDASEWQQVLYARYT
jgi:hypothetical protein